MFFTLHKIYQGQSLLRILMNQSFKQFSVSGKVVDVGGARKPDYFDYLKQESVVSVEIVDGLLSQVDFEKDKLPYSDGYADSVVLANVLEHVYNHAFLVGEVHRILKKGGTLVGFVPFLIQYHPDPHDYFRYTKEALERIFKSAGFSHVQIVTVGRGPFSVNFNTIVLSFPRVVRVLLFPLYHVVDSLFLKFRPRVGERYPLGYSFNLKK